MDGASISATILPLVGVALGTAGTLTGQYLATRGASRRHAESRAAQARAESKEAIVGFLDAAQRVEQVVDARRDGRPLADADVDERLHALWLSKKLIELVCGFDLASFGHKYTSALHALAWSSSIDGPSAQQRELRAEFMEAARRELGIQGPRRYQPTEATKVVA